LVSIGCILAVGSDPTVQIAAGVKTGLGGLFGLIFEDGLCGSGFGSPPFF
jgi:hypothetical protein